MSAPSSDPPVNRARERAREIFPAVLLTVFGMVQALALELLWEGGPERLAAWREISAPATGWALHGTLLVGIVVVWVQFATTVMRIAWTPLIRDLVIPFGIGLLEFTIIELMVPATIAWWFAAMALISATVATVNYTIFARAVREEGRELPSSANRGYVLTGAGTVVLTGFAVASSYAAPAGVVPLIGTLLAASMLIGQLLVFSHFWRIDVGRAG